MIEIDITMGIHILNIFFLIVIMNIVLYKPIRTVLTERKNKIIELSRNIETLNKNAGMRLEEFDRKLTEARKNAKTALETARAEAQGSGNEILATIRQEAETAKAAQLQEIRSQFAAAGTELKSQVENFANEMASKILGRAIQQ